MSPLTRIAVRSFFTDLFIYLGIVFGLTASIFVIIGVITGLIG